MLGATGLEPLSDTQLLALIVGRNGSRYDALTLAVEVMDAAGGLNSLAGASYEELRLIRGIGPSRAAAILAAFELGRRSYSGAARGRRLGSSYAVYEMFWPYMSSERVELFQCALVDSKLRFISSHLISRGTLTASIVHPREAFRPAIRNSASGVIFAHNHPSGDPCPSEEDGRITGRLQEVGKILGVPLLDHVICGDGGAYYSYADAGLLDPQSCYRGMVLR